MCEECGLKSAGFGMASDRKRLWCGPCGKPKGAIKLTGSKMCEDCGNSHAHYGLIANRKRLWCSVCSKQHAGAELLSKAQMCVGCTRKRAHYGVQGGKAQWCADCGASHGAVRITAQGNKRRAPPRAVGEGPSKRRKVAASAAD